jgi:hypothetical protein
MSAPVGNLILRLDAKRSGEGWLAKCPAHDDRQPSLSISEGRDGRVLLHCHAGCALDEILSAAGLTKRDLFPESAHRRSANGAARRAATFDWKTCNAAFTDRHIEDFARWRAYQCESAQWLKENHLIGIYDGKLATPVIQNGSVIGAHYRLKDGRWRYFPTGINTQPLVVGELIPGESAMIFESTLDGFAYLDKSGERSGIIIARGAGNAKLAGACIPQGSTAYVFTQNDKPGADFEKALVSATKCSVKRVKIPAPHKDLNDWTRAGATDKDLLDAIVNAETLREAEKSWTEALNESVVTSSELHELQLTPRKKLLGDWFCEGDLGFIFAFRGVGKTWLALAKAQALSAGGKLGEWQAHEAVGPDPRSLRRTKRK